jgi:hypothetical protein
MEKTIKRQVEEKVERVSSDSDRDRDLDRGGSGSKSC